MTPDVLLSWPRDCDYPLWREWLARERRRFGKVVVVFTDHDGADYSAFVREQLADLALCLDSQPAPGQDWRDAAVNLGLGALALDGSDWVWFTEQDFLITDPSRFWTSAESWTLAANAMGFQEDERWHPGCLFVRRRLVDLTTRYFGPEPRDHFWTFGLELAALTPIATLPSATFEHLKGVSQNHYLIHKDIEAGIFRPERFRNYLRDCLAADVQRDPRWEAEVRAWLG